MKKLFTLACTAIIACSTALTFAGNKAEVIIPGKDLSKIPFVMAKGLVDGEDYLSKTIIFKVKPQYRQNCKVNSVDNILVISDFLNTLGAQNLAKIYPNHRQPEQEYNSLGQKLVDLSLIYSFKYTLDMKLEKVINQLKSLGYFEYVEPWYVPKIHLNPNDPSWNANQYHLKGNVTGSINTTTAWNTQTGNPAVIVGIVDTGTEPTHPDLAPNYAGGYDLGMNDADPTWQGNNHGCAVSGDACAATNNSIGVASPGFNCKFKAAKGADASGALVAVYAGVTWCADNGCKIINCSWGGGGGGSYGQNIIDYAVINKNCLVVASAGNGNADQQLYPSSYNNVYRVASSTTSDSRSSFSDYGNDVDYSSPGSNIYSTINGTGYGSMSGTSMASPVSAGAAALVQSQFSYPNATQIGERLKQTAEIMTGTASNTQALFTAGKLGKGRIDVGDAVNPAITAKSLLANPITITDSGDDVFMPSEVLSITALYTNYLDPSSSSASALLSVVSGPGTVNAAGNPFTIGALTTLQTRDQNSPFAPFTVNISAGALVNDVIQFKLTITDGAFTGSQYFSVVVNEDYVNITINDVFTSITSKGRIGYNADGQQQGLGFEYQLPTPENLLYEMSLMIGTSGTKVSDMFRGGAAGDTDFGSLLRAYEVTPAVVSDFDVDGKFNDAPSASGPIPVEVNHNAYAWNASPYRKFVIVKYDIKNTSASTLNNLYAGILADWDITNAGQNEAAYDAANKMGYSYMTGAGGKYAAFKLLTGAGANHYVVDNIAGGNGGVDPVGGTPAFDTQEKYTALSSPARPADGFGAGGGDVMNCMSTGPLSITAGNSVIVAFAIIAGDNLADIQNSACQAQAKWDNTGPCSTNAINEVTAENLWMETYPNPASSIVTIHYNIAGNSSGSLKLMNSLGEVVMTLDNISAGSNNLTLDVSKLSAGNYFCHFKAGEAVLTKNLTIAR